MAKCVLTFALLSILTWIPPPFASASPVHQTETPPENASEILAKARSYATAYIDRLPNFICVQTTTHSTAGKKGDRWHKRDIQTAQLVFADGKEKRTLQAVNGKLVSNGPGRVSRNQLTTEGEFGILLANVLDQDSPAEISWGGFQDFRNQQVAVVKYSVDQHHSTLRLSRSYLAAALVAYNGEIFIDPKTGAVLRITKELSNIPPELETESSRTVIDYDKVVIGGSDYLLPSSAYVEMTIRSGRLRNEMSFSDYRKFEANSTITFQP